MSISRRTFMKLGAACGVATAFPLWPKLVLASSSQALPIPPLVEAGKDGRFDIAVGAGKTNFTGSASTVTWGYNGSLLGPAFHMKRGQQVAMHVKNTLQEETAVHWHGMELPGVADGGPQAVVRPGGTWEARFTVDQPAATCWFHPHTHGKTGYHVAMGLGGLLIVDDDTSLALPLPNTWGVDDIPVILQDKRLNAEQQIDYAIDVMTAAVGWFGDMMLTNGVQRPVHKAPSGWLRLRFLNGCNARSLRLATSDKRPMYVVASDGGLLAEPVIMQELPLFMGERFEVLIDASDGKPFEIVTLPVPQMGMVLPPFDKALPVLRIEPTADVSTKKLPDTLASIPSLPSLSGLPSRTLTLGMDPRLDMEGMQELMRRYGERAMAGMNMDGHSMGGNAMSGGMAGHNMAADTPMSHGAMAGHGSGANAPLNLHGANFINGQAFKMDVPAFDVKLGQYERWVISGEGDMMLHPFHIHGAQFRILSENGKEPAAHRSGWKDVVVVENAQSEVLIRFMYPAPKERAFMAHCHLLEHEDTGHDACVHRNEIAEKQ